MSMSTTNCTIIARRASTIRLFFSVTNASLSRYLPFSAERGGAGRRGDGVPGEHEHGYKREEVDACFAGPCACVAGMVGSGRERMGRVEGDVR